MKIPKTLGLSEELWDEIEDRRGAMNRSAFVEVCLLELFKAQDELRARELQALGNLAETLIGPRDDS